MASLLDDLAPALADRPDPRVVVLARQASPPVLDELRARWPGLRPVVVDLAASEGSLDGLDAQVRLDGPLDAIVDVARGRLVDRLQSVLWHLRAGGVVVARLHDDPDRRARAAQRLAELAREHQTARRPDPKRRRHDRRPNPERDREAVAWALDEVRLEVDHVVLRSRATALAKVAEPDVVDLLAHRPDLGAVLEVHPAETFVARGTVDSSSGAHRALPTSYDVPAVSLRRWDEATCRPGGVVTSGSLVLPESWRRPARRRLRHLDLADVAAGAVLAPETPPVRRLEGAWLHLDHEIRGHFGHATTEQLAHVWGWARLREVEPDARVLVSQASGIALAAWELDLLAAAGIAREAVHVVDEPVVVERLYGTTQLFDNPGWVSPRLLETWDAVGAALEAAAPASPWPERVFLTRRGTNRACHNTAEVEAVFTAAGFEVVLPETLPLAEQVTLVRRAGVVAGFAGSGLFHIAFADTPRRVIAVGSESYSAQNEWLFAAARGHHLDLVECVPDHPFEGRWDAASFQSDFTFDAQREGVFLQRVLAEL